jgi:hypothetical protein
MSVNEESPDPAQHPRDGTYEDGNFDGRVEASEELFVALLRSRFGDLPALERVARRLALLSPVDGIRAVERAAHIDDLTSAEIPMTETDER